MRFYTVSQNEDLRSILFRLCGTADTTKVLEYKDNQKLFSTRTEYVLHPGDKVWIPDERGIPIHAWGNQGFVINPSKGRALVLRVQTKSGNILANLPYKLYVIDGSEFPGGLAARRCRRRRLGGLSRGGTGGRDWDVCGCSAKAGSIRVGEPGTDQVQNQVQDERFATRACSFELPRVNPRVKPDFFDKESHRAQGPRGRETLRRRFLRQ